MPLFTEAEVAEWARRRAEAEENRPTDRFPYPNNQYNENRSQRTQAWRVAFKIDWLRHVLARPEDVLDVLLVAFHEKGSVPLDLDSTIGCLGDRLTAANTPETRKHVHAILRGLRQVPRSWAKSATTRFFRGVGVQGKPPWSDKPGAGVLGKDYGWTTLEAEWFVSLFYNRLRDVFFPDDSPDPYTPEGHEIDDEGGNRFAATRKERNDEFFDAMLKILEDRGLAADIDKPNIPPPKPHKVKVFKPGDKVTVSNVRDLPSGSHIRFTLHLWNRYAQQSSMVTHHHVLEAVYVGKTKAGIYEIRPVVGGMAMAVRQANKYLVCDAEYVRPWTGAIEEDVEPKAHKYDEWAEWRVSWAWKPLKSTTTQGKDTSVPLVDK